MLGRVVSFSVDHALLDSTFIFWWTNHECGCCMVKWSACPQLGPKKKHPVPPSTRNMRGLPAIWRWTKTIFPEDRSVGLFFKTSLSDYQPRVSWWLRFGVFFWMLIRRFLLSFSLSFGFGRVVGVCGFLGIDGASLQRLALRLLARCQLWTGGP